MLDPANVGQVSLRPYRGGRFEHRVASSPWRFYRLSIAGCAIAMSRLTCSRPSSSIALLVKGASSSSRLAQGWVKNFEWETIGILAEALLDRLPQSAPPNYVHVSSGFAGFAKGGFRLADLESFSEWMCGKLDLRGPSRSPPITCSLMHLVR